MAIVACSECARRVSDKAVQCPHCGVPIAGGVTRRPRRGWRWLFGAFVWMVLAWAALATVWLTGALPVPKEVADVLGIGSRAVRSVSATDKTVPQIPHGASAPPVLAAKPVSGAAVYRTSIEQLYQDYDANEVAVQGKIGDNPVRVSGTVADIHEDAGHPVVTLHTGSENAADLVLTDDQRTAAAHLSKDDAVEIQCNTMRRMAARLHGGGCALVLVDAGAKLAYLTVSLAGAGGNASVYVAGPMLRTACAASSDTTALQLTGNSTSDRIRYKSCAATAGESLAREGCRLSSSMPAIPDLPSAHLWKYDCAAPDAEPLSARAGSAKANPHGAHHRAAPLAVAAVSPVSPPVPASHDAPFESGAAALAAPVPAAAATAVAAPAAIPESPSGAGAQPSTPASTNAAVEGPPAPKRETSGSPSGVSAPAAVDSGDAAGAQPVVVDVRSTSATPAPPPAATDDLASVRSKDPQAADRIVSYCSKLTRSAANGAAAARCRRDEMDAWTRLTVQNEFPTLDDASRRKCNEPPFPESFVALESCAKYQLHLD